MLIWGTDRAPLVVYKMHVDGTLQPYDLSTSPLTLF